MDCSLATWPSIAQFDDLTWMGLGDIDPLESLDRNLENDSQFTESSFTNPEESNSTSSAAKAAFNDASAETPHAKTDDFYRLTSSESLAAARWESINAVDLASVLESFPSNNETSTPGAEDVYDIYSESIILQAEPPLAGGVDVFMSEAVLPELPEADNTVPLSEDKSPRNDVSVISSDHTSLSCNQEDVACEVSIVGDESPPSVNAAGSIRGSVSHRSIEDSLLRRGDCNAQLVKYVDSSCSGSSANVMQPAGSFAFRPMKLPDCVDPGQGALNLRQSIAISQTDSMQPGMLICWSKPTPTLANPHLYNGEQVVQQTSVRSYPAIIDQQLRMADAARVTSELKRNRAQASRARRLAASQRRAKKYPLQKLIRMSSSPASSRDKVDQDITNPAAMQHQSMQPPSHNQQPTATPRAHAMTFLPIAQSTQLASGRELLSHANGMQGVSHYHPGHQSSALRQDNPVSPCEKNSLQAKHGEQNVQASIAFTPSATSHTSNPTDFLDAVVLNQLENTIIKMNVDTRLCIRDALYRLARSAKFRQNRSENVPGLGANASHADAMETTTNFIDRWIVNMLFCKQSGPFDVNSQPLSAQIPNQSTKSNNTNTLMQQWNSCGGTSQPLSAQTPNQSIESSNTNTLMQQWNSCGSFLNLQDPPLHVVTGL